MAFSQQFTPMSSHRMACTVVLVQDAAISCLVGDILDDEWVTQLCDDSLYVWQFSQFSRRSAAPSSPEPRSSKTEASKMAKQAGIGSGVARKSPPKLPTVATNA